MITFTWEGKEVSKLEVETPPKTTCKLPQKINGNEIHICDNLDFLKCNIERLKGKVKCIYIDPPYNTGKDFIYKDKLHKGKECKHSKWLSFMYPRLVLARELLREDGVIFISIDDNGQANLRLLMNEIFGEGEFVANGIWQHTIQAKNDNTKISLHHNSILIYSKSDNFVIRKIDRTEEHNTYYSNPDNDPNGEWRFFMR